MDGSMVWSNWRIVLKKIVDLIILCGPMVYLECHKQNSVRKGQGGQEPRTILEKKLILGVLVESLLVLGLAGRESEIPKLGFH